jgi:hypothetical protein
MVKGVGNRDIQRCILIEGLTSTCPNWKAWNGNPSIMSKVIGKLFPDVTNLSVNAGSGVLRSIAGAICIKIGEWYIATIYTQLPLSKRVDRIQVVVFFKGVAMAKQRTSWLLQLKTHHARKPSRLKADTACLPEVVR